MERAPGHVDGTVARWVLLSDFLGAVSSARTESVAVATALERSRDAFAATATALVANGDVVGSVGLPDVVPIEGLELPAGATDGAGSLFIPGVGDCHVLAAPVAASPGAVLVIARDRPEFELEDVVLVRGMARALSLTIGLLATLDEERELRQSLQERQALLERLAQIQRSIVHRAPLTDVLRAVCQGASALTGDEVVGLRLLDPDDAERLVMVADFGIEEASRPLLARSKLTEGVGGRAVLEERLVVADDYAAFPFAHEHFVHDGLQAAMAAPVLEGRRVIGSLTVATYRAGRRYSKAEQEALLAFAEHASLALNDARTVEALHSTLRDALLQATHDPLTGLPNRSILFEHLEELFRLHRPDIPGGSIEDSVALLFIDLDRFKAVNDSLGHDVGDRVLVTVANRLRSAVRPSDLVARLAGDEFVVVCSGLHGQVDALGLADRIAREVAVPIAVAGRDVVVTASIGIAQLSSGSPMTADQLLRDADMAMYRAKERGSDRVEVFGRNLRSEVRERVDLEHALRRAILREEFRIEYQPIVELHTGTTLGVEALLRWEHDGRLVPPANFIRVAEETGLIVPIGGWVLRSACEQVAMWRSLPGLEDLSVSVNVSMRQFEDDAFVDGVTESLAATGLDAQALWLEVTESMLLDDVEQGIATLRRLRERGVRLAIDDFGTGYSSLSYLRRFPVNALKIDRSFVEHLEDDPVQGVILEAIVTLGQALAMTVVCEGIETAAQLREIHRLGMHAAQGYHLAPPLSPAAALSWLRERDAAGVAPARVS